MADIFPMWKSRSHRGENSTRWKQCFNLFGNAGQLGTITRKQIESKYSPKKVTNVNSAFRRIVPTWFGHVVRSRGPRVSQCLIINFVFFFVLIIRASRLRVGKLHCCPEGSLFICPGAIAAQPAPEGLKSFPNGKCSKAKVCLLLSHNSVQAFTVGVLMENALCIASHSKSSAPAQAKWRKMCFGGTLLHRIALSFFSWLAS